jgi:opacity protein-like surface antigen
MSSLRIIALAAVAASALSLQPARAADMPMPPPPPPVEEFGGWYLRGHIGMSNQGLKQLDNISFATAPGFTWLDRGGFDSAPIFGVGLGYQYNSWLRFDLTGEWRGGASFKALDQYTDVANCPPPNNFCTNDYSAIKKEWLFLANAYLDLGTWWCLTPFVGVGVGAARHNVAAIHDVGLIADGTTGFGLADKDNVNWSFAWAVHAGLGYSVSNNLKLEIAYRYLNMGNAESAVVNCSSAGCANTGGPAAFYTLTDLDSHDFKIGMRWLLNEPAQAPVYAPPLMRKG